MTPIHLLIITHTHAIDDHLLIQLLVARQWPTFRFDLKDNMDNTCTVGCRLSELQLSKHIS